MVRGCDLLDSTARQIYLQQLLGYRMPHYCHLPVITNAQGQKFSKQNHAAALIDSEATQNLRRALAFLQQEAPPVELTSSDSVLSFACNHWSIDRIPRGLAIADTAVPGLV